MASQINHLIADPPLRFSVRRQSTRLFLNKIFREGRAAQSDSPGQRIAAFFRAFDSSNLIVTPFETLTNTASEYPAIFYLVGGILFPSGVHNQGCFKEGE